MKKNTYAFLDKLITAISPSGYEDEAARVWQDEARAAGMETRRDVHGNTDAILNPGGTPRVMLSGHYDEIGFLITHIDDDGYCWLGPIGGWDPQIPQGHRVVIRGRHGHVPGVIGKCPIHLLKPDQRDKVVKLEELWVDIGVKNKAQAEHLVSIGDPLVLNHCMRRLQDDVVTGRGFDNRAGAFVVLEAARRLQKKKIAAEVHAVATVQEEIGLRGARTAGFGIDPQVCIAVDVTFATDHPSMGDAVRREGKVKIGKGPALTRGPNINPRLFELLVDTAKKNDIPVQIVAEPLATGTDANALQISRAGTATALVSIPNRYMHSPCEIVSLGDLEACAELIAHTVARIKPDTSFVPF